MRLPHAVAFCLYGLMLFVQGCGSGTPVEMSLSPQSAIVFSTQSVQLTATDSVGSADVVWTVTGPAGPAPSGVLDASGNFTAPEVTQNTNFTVTVASMRQPTKTASATITVIASGQVSATTNPQVALYSFTAPTGTTAFIEFSSDTSYGLKTWTQPAPTSGGTQSFLVAGMLANTPYHMRAVVQTGAGATANDVDHIFTTTAIPANLIPPVTVTTTAGMTPQPGIEFLDLTATGTASSPLAAFDLSGNLLWSYPPQGTASDLLQGVHLLPNGHFLMNISPVNTATIGQPSSVAGTIYVLREIDLAGTTIREETLDALNAALPGAGVSFTVGTFHHDVIALPNGHWIALGNIVQPCVGIPACATYPNILGDVLIDLAPQSDGTFLPVWTWNSFDHLDISRAPMGLPDWTHSNAILYSPDDGNLLLSIRHQGWIIKIDYANGQGAGDILWRLGEGGDFTLVGGTDPTDWFYAQHGPSFVSTNTAGKFSLAVMDNGNSRVYPSGDTCASLGNTVCPYSSAPILEIDETAKTATLLSNYHPGEYSFWGGNAEVLGNGNLEANFNAGAPGNLTDLLEITSGSSPEVVWRLTTSAQNAYRGFRMPSLYPVVQW
ncbi:MAG: aryl-sulfate sulfotransferase [Candidatus Acidiferrum sp.]